MGKPRYNELCKAAYMEKPNSKEDISLEAWIERHSAAKKLQENLRSVLDNTTNLTKREKDDVMRLNMIMVRQFGEDCGLE